MWSTIAVVSGQTDLFPFWFHSFEQQAWCRTDMKATWRLKACESLAFADSYLTSDSVCKEWHCRPFFVAGHVPCLVVLWVNQNSFPEVEDMFVAFQKLSGKKGIIEFPSTFRKNVPNAVTYEKPALFYTEDHPRGFGSAWAIMWCKPRNYFRRLCRGVWALDHGEFHSDIQMCEVDS